MFLHCWTENENFKDIVQCSWQEEVSGDPMWKLHQKMKEIGFYLEYMV